MKTTREAALQEMQTEHAKKLAALNTEWDILESLPDVGFEWRIHVHSLYGTVAGANLGDRFGGRFGQPVVTLEAALKAAEALPAAPLVKVRDSCLSFQPKAYVDSLPEEKKERWEEEQDVAPFTVKVDDAVAELEWNTPTPAGLVRVGIYFPLHIFQIGRINTVRKEVRGSSTARGDITSCQFKATEKAGTIFRGAEPLAQMESPIRWASGSPEAANPFTLYWVALRDDVAPEVGDLLRTMQS